MKYTTQDALDIARQLEPLLVPHGIHVAIGGSLVYRGDSEKDIDIFLYPHNRNVDMNPTMIAALLENRGYGRREGSEGKTEFNLRA